MVKVIILIGRANSGKTRTINQIGKILGLKKHRKLGDKFCPSWSGEGLEVYMDTGSMQENAKSIFADISSLQEKNKLILEKVMKSANQWLSFLRDNQEAIAIIPFTLTGKEAMEKLILQPLNLFRKSMNDVNLIYLEKKNIKEKRLVENVIQKASPNHIIKSIKGDEERQAKELILYLNLKKKS